jgi:hypothetical protein
MFLRKVKFHLFYFPAIKGKGFDVRRFELFIFPAIYGGGNVRIITGFSPNSLYNTINRWGSITRKTN